MTPDQVAHAIMCELERAYAKHGREQWGRHEFYAILKEEVDELWEDIKSDAPQENVRKEAIQIAAMVFRYLDTGDRYREPAVSDKSRMDWLLKNSRIIVNGLYLKSRESLDEKITAAEPANVQLDTSHERH